MLLSCTASSRLIRSLPRILSLVRGLDSLCLVLRAIRDVDATSHSRHKNDHDQSGNNQGHFDEFAGRRRCRCNPRTDHGRTWSGVPLSPADEAKRLPFSKGGSALAANNWHVAFLRGRSLAPMAISSQVDDEMTELSIPQPAWLLLVRSLESETHVPCKPNKSRTARTRTAPGK